jgi:hypothetical protein
LAGQAIAEIVLAPSFSPNLKAKVYHVVNPHISSWTTILEGLHKGGLTFQEVEPKDWLRILAQSDPDMSRNPTHKLLVSFWSLPL